MSPTLPAPEPRAATVALPYRWDAELLAVLAELPEAEQRAKIAEAKRLTVLAPVETGVQA